MKLLFLRGQVPQDRDPREIMFDNIEGCDDVWTQLAWAMLEGGGYGEIWYWGGKRVVALANNFVERWVPDFGFYRTKFDPDVVFCRGGFPEYDRVLKRYPRAIKIYYGAGNRHLPSHGGYDLILQDSKSQLSECALKYPDVKSSLFIKPAADNIFSEEVSEKVFDVCFPANGTQPFKGHKFLFSTLPDDIRMLHLGFPYKNRPKGVITKRVARSELSGYYSKCRVGVVCCDAKPDSCPRVIPEMLACGLPLVVLNTVRFWSTRYMNGTGVIVGKDSFWDSVRSEIANPRNGVSEYYQKHLSVKVSAKFILNLL